MILAVAATEFEMQPFVRAAPGEVARLVCGVGVLESCLTLSRYLFEHGGEIAAVVLFGVGGAYPEPARRSPGLLDICLAETEVFGDFGICFPRRIDDLPAEFGGGMVYTLDADLYRRARRTLAAADVPVWSGNFVTVAGVSGSRERGEILARKYDGLCENMEGAAAARVCRAFSLPLLELRCVSNRVEDRDPDGWKLGQAAERGAAIAALVVAGLEEEYAQT